jgi:hypothetical protein
MTTHDTSDAGADRLLRLADDIATLIEAAANEGVCPHCLGRTQVAVVGAFAMDYLGAPDAADWLIEQAGDLRTLVASIPGGPHH